ncbi:MAG: hypothetical protein WDM89_11195 [Rhizomicrobium sp.]
MYGFGVSKVGELIDLGVKAGIVEKSGSWYSYDGTRIGQGRESAKNFLTQNAEMAGQDRSPDPRECGRAQRRAGSWRRRFRWRGRLIAKMFACSLLAWGTAPEGAPETAPLRFS